ncbi:MAG: hypothetical protein ABI743_04920 [bacterium]
MQAEQPAWLFPVALIYIMILAPIMIWAGFHFMHHFEEETHGKHDDQDEDKKH